MFGFHTLSDESYKLIYKLYKKKVISEKFYREIESAEYLQQLVNVFVKNLDIKEVDKPFIIWHITKIHWKWDKFEKERRTVFNEFKSIFIYRIINKGGVYSREECISNELTDQQVSKHVSELEEKEVVMSLRMSRGLFAKTIYFINPEIVQKSKEELKNFGKLG